MEMAKRAKCSDANLFKSSFLPTNWANVYPGQLPSQPPGQPALPPGPLEAFLCPLGFLVHSPFWHSLWLRGLRNINAVAISVSVRRIPK